MAAIPFIPGMPPFWIVLLDNIGLAALVAMGLVLLTGVGGLTSFGQAAFCGFGAYTTAVLTTAYGLSPWLTLPLSLLVSAASPPSCSASSRCGCRAIICRSAPSPGASACFICSASLNSLAVTTASRPSRRCRSARFRMIDPGTIYFAIWIAVLLCALLTMNLLDSRTGRAIRALRRGHVAAEAFGVQTPRAKLLVFIYAAVLAGLSGWLYAHFQRAANPTPFGAQAGIEYLFIAVVGGAGYVWGGVLGAAIVVDPEGNPAELFAVSVPRRGPARDHRVRHPAGGAAATRADRGLALADGAAAAETRAQAARHRRLPCRRGRKPRPSAAAAAAGRSSAQAVRRRDRGQQCLLRRPGPRDRRADRTQRRRQEHDLQPDHRRAHLLRRQDLGARQKHRQRAAAGSRQARHLQDLPARQAGARHDRAGKRRDRRAFARPLRRARQHVPARSRR